MDIRVNDILVLKKPHPCSNKKFRVMRIGSDIKVVCIQCSRELTVPRVKLEKSIKEIIRENT